MREQGGELRLAGRSAAELHPIDGGFDSALIRALQRKFQGGTRRGVSELAQKIFGADVFALNAASQRAHVFAPQLPHGQQPERHNEQIGPTDARDTKGRHIDKGQQQQAGDAIRPTRHHHIDKALHAGANPRGQGYIEQLDRGAVQGVAERLIRSARENARGQRGGKQQRRCAEQNG